MGNSASSSDRRHQQHPQQGAPPTYQQHPSATHEAAHLQPLTYVPQAPAYPPPNYAQRPPYGPAPASGPYSNTSFYPAPPLIPSAQQQQPYVYQQRAQVPTQEYQTTATIRNQVNLKKQTLRLEPTSNPQILQISFRFDASTACRVSTFICGREDKRTCLITTTVAPAPVVKYDKGLDHKFPLEDDAAAAAAHTLNIVRYNAKDLTTPQPDAFPIIIRLEALTDKGRAENRSMEGLEPGCKLPDWVQSQTTYAKLIKEDDGSWGIRVLKQKIWVEGNSYELQEIYGMEQNKAGQGTDGYEEVEGNECVICMSAPRDTTALPCRHMCMCHGCASALKAQTNKCPICRNEIDSLLHIKISKQAPARNADGAASAAS